MEYLFCYIPQAPKKIELMLKGKYRIFQWRHNCLLKTNKQTKQQQQQQQLEQLFRIIWY